MKQIDLYHADAQIHRYTNRQTKRQANKQAVTRIKQDKTRQDKTRQDKTRQDMRPL